MTPTPPRLGRAPRDAYIGAEHAGQRSAILCTIIENCRRRGINPFEYLRDVLTRLPSMTNKQIKDITPEAWAKPKAPPKTKKPPDTRGIRAPVYDTFDLSSGAPRDAYVGEGGFIVQRVNGFADLASGIVFALTAFAQRTGLDRLVA